MNPFSQRMFYVSMVLVTAAALPARPAELVRPRVERVPERNTGRAALAGAAEIMQQLSSGDPAQQKLGVEAIRQRMHATNSLNELRVNWFKQLLASKLYQETADLALEGILAYPQETRNVEAALQARIKSLIQLGKAPEALAAAKGLFNVSGMGSTSDAILAVAEAINAAYPDDVEVFNKFREEQMAGAAAVVIPSAQQPATQPTSASEASLPRVTSSVMAGIKIDARLYDEAVRKLTGEDPATLMGRGNLLLLADRPKEARAVFERMYTLANADVAESSEALARSMKAEDGTVARANSWVLMIRPKR